MDDERQGIRGDELADDGPGAATPKTDPELAQDGPRGDGLAEGAEATEDRPAPDEDDPGAGGIRGDGLADSA